MPEDTLEGGIGDFKAKLQGAQTIYIVILAASLALTGAMLWADIQTAHEEHKTIQQGVEEMVYVQSLTDEQRKGLNLTMPESLMKKRKSAWSTDH